MWILLLFLVVSIETYSNFQLFHIHCQTKTTGYFLFPFFLKKKIKNKMNKLNIEVLFSYHCKTLKLFNCPLTIFNKLKIYNTLYALILFCKASTPAIYYNLCSEYINMAIIFQSFASITKTTGYNLLRLSCILVFQRVSKYEL